MFRHALIITVLALTTAFNTCAGEKVTIDPAKAAQLKRLEPLNAAKIDVFVDAGQLTPAQAVLVKQYVNAQGALNLPPDAIAPEPARQPAPEPARQPAPEPTRQPAVEPAEPAAGSGLSAADRDNLIKLIRQFRGSDHPPIGRELRKCRPAVNELIAGAYKDPVDLPTKIQLWTEVAGAANPGAAFGLFETHRVAYEVARPILVPYAKDIGGALVRRKKTTDSNPYPMERYFTSRELRDMIIDIEGLIAHCSGPAAATFLMDVYAQRYGEGEAPMRDDGRDWRRIVEVCGGDPKHFDDDDPATWSSRLSAADRIGIAEKLLPYLHREDGDRRKIARNGLSVCIGDIKHPAWDAGQGKWEQWWEKHKGDVR
ncbi:MAG: hypothetical protein NTW87_19930 [Planctomycetota bacterium]|nr:hypothetical protein [Planctomycetota bacterium]